MKVAVADDNADILETTRLVLELDGHEAVTIARSQHILPALREGVDLLLQDMNMPGLDLAAHLAAIRADPALADLPVVVFSAELPDERRLLDLGADAVLCKPFELSELRSIIGKLSP